MLHELQKMSNDVGSIFYFESNGCYMLQVPEKNWVLVRAGYRDNCFRVQLCITLVSAPRRAPRYIGATKPLAYRHREDFVDYFSQLYFRW